jgi:hypothetical protein
MSLLAPLYIAGALAIALPIIFHLIKRTPHNRQPFSSLMFLVQSPPRLTRRSRLTNILLLILRAAAICLLAAAFARPFFQSHAEQNLDPAQGRRIALLVDTSASMQRGDLWDQARRHVEQVLDGVTQADEVAMFVFDRTARPAFTFDQWNELELSRRVPALRAKLADIKPTWASTNLGEALASVADQLAEAHGSQRNKDTARRQIVLISDLQQGAHVEALQGREWPDNVALDVKPVALAQTTNASLQLVREQLDAAPDPGSAGKLRVRVTNQPASAREEFVLTWANARGAVETGEPQKVYVAPGRSQVVKVAWPAHQLQADRLVLHGDDFDFDNTMYIVQPKQDTVRVVYLGDDSPDSAQGLAYYLDSALVDTPQRTVELIHKRGGEPLIEADLSTARLMVIGASLADDRSAPVRRFIDTGGTALWVLTDLEASQNLARLMELDSLDIREAPERDFTLISRVNLDHPLFATFADVRFSDFSRIHFWKYRRLRLPSPDAANVLASFDNGDPFLLEKPIGQGRLLVATSGWQPGDSQLALSTKFVPLIGTLIAPRDPALAEFQYAVGDPIALPNAGDGKRIIHTPDAKQAEPASTATTWADSDQPGIYRIDVNGEQYPLAVNVSADESRTTAMAAADLEQFGAHLGPQATPELVAAKSRQLQQAELENRQKLWRWLLVGVLGLVAMETLLAGRLARRPAANTLQPTS